MFIYTDSDLQKAITWLKGQTEVEYDIETSGLEHRSGAEIIGFGFSAFHTGFYLPIRTYNIHTNQLELIPGSVEKAKQILAILATKRLSTFNGAFDIPFTTAKLGIDLLPALWCDVLLLKHTVDEEFPFKLKEIAVQVFGYGAASEQRDLYAQLKERGATKHELYKASTEVIGKYCIQDCILTGRLRRHYLPLLRAEGLEKFFFEQEVMPLYREVTIPMEQYGLKLDLPLMQQSLAEISVDIAALEASIQSQIKPLLAQGFNEWFLGKDYEFKLTGNFGQGIAKYFGLADALPRTNAGKLSLAKGALMALDESRGQQILLKAEEISQEEIEGVRQLMCDEEHGVNASLFNLQSKHHLKRLFFDTLKLEPLSTTELGNPQVDDNFISSIANLYPWASELQTYNRLNKIKSTYIERFLGGQVDGIFYPSFFQHRTVSGRLASNLQQLPKKVSAKKEPLEVIRKYNNRLRDFFVARPGHKLIGSDYESLEPHIFAHASTDKKLHAIFQRGDDFYSTIAIDTEGLTQYSPNKLAPNYLGELAPDIRQKAKIYGLGIPFGMSGYKLAFELNVPQVEAEKLVQAYLDSYPQLKEWIKSSHDFVLEHGYIRTLAGRVRHLKSTKAHYDKYGKSILDSLVLYKQYGEDPTMYEQMKKVRKEMQNGLNNCINVQCQSMAASIVSKASILIMREFKAKGLKARLCLNVHDEIVSEAPDAEVQEVCEIMQRNMENCYKLDVPLKAVPQVALKYGDTK